MSSTVDSNNPSTLFPSATEANLRLFTPSLTCLILILCYIDPTIQVDALRERVIQIIPRAQLFCAEVHNYSTSYNKISEFLNRNGVNLQTYFSILVINQLANRPYDNAHNKKAAIDLFKNLIACGRHRRNTATEEQEGSALVARNCKKPAERIVKNVAMRLKDAPRKF